MKALVTKPAAKSASKAPVKKPAAKPSKATGDVKVSVTPAPKGKTVRKPDAAKEQFAGKKISEGTTIYLIAESARPTSGQRLFAHTHAALTALGLLDQSRPAVPRQHVLSLLGQRAVTYHTRKMNLESAPDNKVRLTVSGRNWFANRFAEGKVNVPLANAFMALLVEGKPAPGTGVAPANVFPTRLGS